jgi:hypothetical protein
MIAIVYPQFYGVGGIARYLESFLANLPKDSPSIYLITGDEHQTERRYENVKIIHAAVWFTNVLVTLLQEVLRLPPRAK